MKEFDVPVEKLIDDIRINVVDIEDFNSRVVGAYESGTAEKGLEADDQVGRSIIPAGTGVFRDFSYIAPDIPEFISSNCVGCMDCVTECPDTAILGKVIPKAQMEAALAEMSPEKRAQVESDWAKTRKYWQAYEKQGKEPGYFGIFIDPTKCKGCAECVQVCDDHALRMIKKTDTNMPVIKDKFDHFKSRGPTPDSFINDKVLAD